MERLKQVWAGLILILIAGLMDGGPAVAEPVRLSDFKWQNRLIVNCNMIPSQRVIVRSGIGKIILQDEDQARRLAAVWLNQTGWEVVVARPISDAPKISNWMQELEESAKSGDEAAGRLGEKLANSAFVPLDEDQLALFPYRPDCDGCAAEYGERHRQQIANRLNCNAGDEVTALIGLDGDIKQTWRDEVPEPAEVFALIDAMPMRLQELQAERAEELTE